MVYGALSDTLQLQAAKPSVGLAPPSEKATKAPWLDTKLRGDLNRGLPPQRFSKNSFSGA
jgi:hypothetical protein